MTGANTAAPRIRVAIIDDHTLFREGVGLMLALEPDVVLVGEASTVEEGLAVIARTSPDLVLLDLRLAQARGVDVLSRLATAPVAPRVLVVTAFPEEADIVALVGEGLKNREIAERLGSAEKTIKGHLTTIFYKLGVQDRLALALLAVKIHLAVPKSR